MDAELGRPLLQKRRVQRSSSGLDGTLSGRDQETLVHRLITRSAMQPPPRCVACLQGSAKLLEVAMVLLRLIAPVVVAFWTVVYWMYKVIPANELKIIYGIALCFFGGEFCATIAAVECFRRTGGDKLLMCVHDIATNVQVAHKASLEDDRAAEVSKLPPKEYYRHKVSVALKAVDPDTLATACAGLYQGFLGMLVSLKFKFAWTVALACSIADMLRPTIAWVVTPILVWMMPKDYHHWINQIINITLKTLATHFAWKLQEAISAFQSGLMGASLVGTGVLTLVYKGFSWASCGRCCKDKKHDADRSLLDDVIGLPLAFVGIRFQLMNNFRLPFPYNLALMPLTITEWLLRALITWFPVDSAAFPERG